MSTRKWDAKTKAMVVMAGIKGMSVTEICNEYQLPQSMYYKWRDQFLSNLPEIFSKESTNRELDLLRENKRLKKIIGDLTIELKKSEEGW
jgi:transposase-like protein